LLGTLSGVLRLASTDLQVFRLCLGGNGFGWTADERESFVVAPIASARSPQQLADLLQMRELELGEDELRALSSASEKIAASR